MSPALASRLRPLAFVAGAVCAAGIAVWLSRRHDRASAESATDLASSDFDTDELEDSPPNSYTFEAEPQSTRVLSAQPSGRNAGYHTPDDYGALSPEELGAAFLAGATDTALDEPPSSTADLSGFQIFDRDVAEYQSDEELPEDELAEIFERRS
jgi:hypothetical protein